MKNGKKIFISSILLVIVIYVSFMGGRRYEAFLDRYLQNRTDLRGDEVYIERQKNIEYLKNFIKENYYKPVNDEEMYMGELKGIVSSLNDPYSYYMTKEEYEKLNEDTQGEYHGIGIIVSAAKGNQITVVAPIKGTPADKAGIKCGDKIVKINDKEYTSDDLEEAVKVMRGKAGESVKITVLRRDKDGVLISKDFNIVRSTIKLETVSSHEFEDNIGYIAISSFDIPTYDDFMKEYKKLKDRGMKKLIIDLRNNPGGLLRTSTKIAGEFLDGGTIVYTKNRVGKKDIISAPKGAIDIPLLVLVNEGSASASEIITGAFKDRKRAVIMGSKTFGKGIVQTIFNFPNGEGLKITTSEYFTPDGYNIHKKGINPDIEVKLNKDVEVIGAEHLKEDNQLREAIKYMKEH